MHPDARGAVLAYRDTVDEIMRRGPTEGHLD
jgi:hypothetical protein